MAKTETATAEHPGTAATPQPPEMPIPAVPAMVTPNGPMFSLTMPSPGPHQLHIGDKPADLAALLAMMSPEQVAGLAQLAAQPAAPVPGRHRDTGAIAPLGKVETTELLVQMQPRHLAWLTARAEAYGEPPAQHLVRIMLEFRTSDTWSVVATTPTGLGDMAGSAPKLG